MHVSRVNIKNEVLSSAFKMEDITVIGVAELFPHILCIWICFLNSPVSRYSSNFLVQLLDVAY
jgi:hypothetical protein